MDAGGCAFGAVGGQSATFTSFGKVEEFVHRDWLDGRFAQGFSAAL
jgi:hypothetical protein